MRKKFKLVSRANGVIYTKYSDSFAELYAYEERFIDFCCCYLLSFTCTFYELKYGCSDYQKLYIDGRTFNIKHHDKNV